MAELDPAIEIMEKVDEAFVAWFASLKGTSLQYEDNDGATKEIPILKLWDDDDKDANGVVKKVTLPYVMIASTDADQRLRDTGNFDVEFQIEIRSSAKDVTRAEHKRRAGVIAAMLWRDDVVSGINGLPARPDDFSAMLLTRGATSREIDEEDDALVTRIMGVMMAAATTFA